MTDILDSADLIRNVGLVGLVLAVVAYVLLFPERAQLVAGWLWSGMSRVWRAADKRAVAHRVEGHINSAAKGLSAHVEEGLFEGKLRLAWTKAEDAQALIREGEVLVCMRRAQHEQQNMANALMAYLPKAVVPRARRYVDPVTMRAADLVVAKAVLGQQSGLGPALETFLDEHMTPACSDASLRARVEEIDEIDLHGWLLRVLLPEYRRLGDALYPSVVDDRCRQDAEEFARWLHRLATREPGSTSASLHYRGRFLHVAVIFVAIRGRIEAEGLRPYRQRAKRYLYRDRCDAVYLMARDDNIESVKDLVADLATDGRVALTHVTTYRLRKDFKAKQLDRERAVIGVLVRRRQQSEVPASPFIGDSDGFLAETFEFDSLPEQDVDEYGAA